MTLLTPLAMAAVPFWVEPRAIGAYGPRSRNLRFARRRVGNRRAARGRNDSTARTRSAVRELRPPVQSRRGQPPRTPLEIPFVSIATTAPLSVSIPAGFADVQALAAPDMRRV